MGTGHRSFHICSYNSVYTKGTEKVALRTYTVHSVVVIFRQKPRNTYAGIFVNMEGVWGSDAMEGLWSKSVLNKQTRLNKSKVRHFAKSPMGQAFCKMPRQFAKSLGDQAVRKLPKHLAKSLASQAFYKLPRHFGKSLDDHAVCRLPRHFAKCLVFHCL